MLISLGHTLRTRVIPSGTVGGKAFSFVSSLPSEFTYTRSDVSATYRDNIGAWQQSAMNTPRFDHDASGSALGLRFEPPRINKANHVNFAPVDIGGITKTGDGAATIIADAEFANATIGGAVFNDLQNGNVVQLTGGTTGTTFKISMNADNINKHSYRILAAPQSDGYHGNVKLSSGVALNNFSAINGEWEEIIEENIDVNHSTRYLAAYVSAGKTVHIGAVQFEEGAFITSPIITTGSIGATREREVCVALGLDTANWFSNTQGAIICEAVFDRPNGFDYQQVFLANEGTGLSNAMGMYMNNTEASQMRARDIIDSVNNQNDDIHKPIAGKRFPMAISWQDGESQAVAGGMRYNHRMRAGSPTGMDRIYIGGRPFNNAMSGWVQSLTVYNQFRTLPQLGEDMFPNVRSYRAIASGGQSNKHGWYRSQTEYMNSGEISAVTELDTVWDGSENWMINGSMNGSFAIKQNDPNAGMASENWWYDPMTDTFGNRMQDWENMITAFGVDRIEAFDWDQGESDSASTKVELKVAWLAIFNHMRSVAGDKPVFITPIGRRSDYQATNFNTLRQAQWELVSENSWIHLMPEKFNEDLADQVHLTDAGYGAYATIHTRRMLDVLGESVSGGTTPPLIVGAVRDGTDVTVSLSITAGDDFAPTTGIAGFHFFDNGVEIAITSAVRTTANTITLSLASAPTGSETLYYGYGSLYDEVSNYGNLVRDNAGLPLWASVIVL